MRINPTTKNENNADLLTLGGVIQLFNTISSIVPMIIKPVEEIIRVLRILFEDIS
jgi:hypothetical protein